MSAFGALFFPPFVFADTSPITFLALVFPNMMFTVSSPLFPIVFKVIRASFDRPYITFLWVEKPRGPRANLAIAYPNVMLFAASSPPFPIVFKVIRASCNRPCIAFGWHYYELHYAAEGGDVEVVKVLLAAGAGAKNGYRDGWTPLHEASRYGHVSTKEIPKMVAENLHQA